MTVNSCEARRRRLADRVASGEQMLANRGADDADAGGALLLDRREVASALDRPRVDVLHVLRLADQVDVGQILVAEARVRRGRGRGAGHSAIAARVAHRGVVVAGDLLVLQSLDDHFVIGGGKRRAGHLKDVRAEVGDLGLDVDVGALNERHHGDQSSHAHGQTERRQSGAQPVRAECVEAQTQGVARGQHALKRSLSSSASRRG
jgi:hypothetical protein